MIAGLTTVWIAVVNQDSVVRDDWYKDGKMEKKQNTFRDFISCGQFLIDKGYTRKGNIVAQGGSAGGDVFSDGLPSGGLFQSGAVPRHAGGCRVFGDLGE